MNFFKVVFIDNQRLFLQGMIALIEKIRFPVIKIAGAYNRFEDFNKEFDGDANIIFLEFDNESGQGIEVIKKIRSIHNNIKIVVLSAYKDYKYVKEAIRSGADGYLLKSTDITDFESCIIDIMENKTYLGNGVHLSPPMSVFKNKYQSNVVSTATRFEQGFELKQKLTKRESEVLRLITQAKSLKQISDMLYISDQTVGVHKKSIMRKLGTNTTVQLIKYAFENDIV